MLALAQAPSLRMDLGVRTYVGRTALEFSRVLDQHTGYCRALADCGAQVRVLEVNAHFPDGVFIEDTAVVLDEIAVLASMGTASRRAEPPGVEQALQEYRDVVRLDAPANLEGGDVLRIGRRLLVGLSSRTNAAGIEALTAIVNRHDYVVQTVPVRQCLHLKTACTALPDGRLLVNPAWIDVSALAGLELLSIPKTEPWAANVLLANQAVLLAADHVQTIELIDKLGFDVHPVQISEFAKAEGGVTCLSLLLS